MSRPPCPSDREAMGRVREAITSDHDVAPSDRVVAAQILDRRCWSAGTLGLFAAASLVFLLSPSRAILSGSWTSASALASGLISLLMFAACAFVIRQQLRLRRWRSTHLIPQAPGHEERPPGAD